jgi:hypothetical protein
MVPHYCLYVCGLQVPPRWQVLLGAAEWLLTMLTTAAIQVNYYGAPLHRALTQQQVVLTLLLVWVIPTLASCCWESAPLDAPVKQCKGSQQEDVPLVHRCVHAISRWCTHWRLRLPALRGHPGSRTKPAAGPHCPTSSPSPAEEQQGDKAKARAPACASGQAHHQGSRGQVHGLSPLPPALPGADMDSTEQTPMSPSAGTALSAQAAPHAHTRAQAAAQQPAMVPRVPLSMRGPWRQQVARKMQQAAQQAPGQRIALPSYTPVCCLTPASVKVRAAFRCTLV